MIIDKNLISLNSDTILNSITDGVIVIGMNNDILFKNQAADEIIKNIGKDKIIPSEKCMDVMGHSGCTLGCLLKTTLETGESISNYEASFFNNGKSHLLNVNTALLKDENNAVIGGIEIIRDISLIKELEDELKGRYSFNNFVGKNHKIQEIFSLVKDVAPTRATVLIEGETGTGKELIASAIHYNSQRKDESFVKLNCASLSEGLLESELFGHVKGAFTGAIAVKKGRFDLAHKGTLFLDEIADISPQTQVKLLRVLQEGEYEPVGSDHTKKADVRIIGATNKILKEEVKKGNFREDLFYRLKVVTIDLPPLRERKDDIPLLIKHFKDKYNKSMDKKITNLSPSAMEILLSYNYPGNIRELEHIIEHAIVMCQSKTINPKHLPKDISKNDFIGNAIKSNKPLKELEKEVILRALEETKWKLNDTAKKLNMSRTTLWRKIKNLNISK